jgi:antitoxin HicB
MALRGASSARRELWAQCQRLNGRLSPARVRHFASTNHLALVERFFPGGPGEKEMFRLALRFVTGRTLRFVLLSLRLRFFLFLQHLAVITTCQCQQRDHPNCSAPTRHDLFSRAVGFLVHVPALPEVVTSGDTEEEALAMARGAIELVLESRRERGEGVPVDVAKPKLREVTVSVAA